MAEMVIVAIRTTHVLFSWTTGVVPAKIPNRIKSDNDALAYAMYLTRHGRPEEAEAFLDEYCA